MSTQLIKIFGQLTDIDGNNLAAIPFGITVEFTRTTESSSPGGWIGSAPVSVTDGHFEVFTSYNMPSVEEVNYRVLNGKQEVQTGLVTFDTFEANIALTEDAYNDLFVTEASGYTMFRGKVTLGEELIAAIPASSNEVQVTINKKGFRSTATIGTSTLNDRGSYTVRVQNSDLFTQPCDADHSAINNVTATLSTIDPITEETVILATSAEIVSVMCGKIANLHIEDEDNFKYFLTESDYLRSVLTTVDVVDESEIKDIVIEGNDQELNTLTAATGIEAYKWAAFVKAAGIAHQLGVALEKVYPLTRKSCQNIYDVAILSNEQIAEMVSEAGNNHIIDLVESVEDLLDALSDKRTAISGEELTDNDETLLSVLTAIMNSETDALTFLKLSAIAAASDATDLWTEVNTALGNTKKVKLQKALQLLAITGMQKEMTISLLDFLGSAKVSSLALEAANSWEARILQVNALHDKVCIPKIITDNYTTEEAIDVYAASIHESLTDIFATTVLVDKLDNDEDFGDLFPNKEDIKTFVSGQDGFDLRVDNLWDIEDDGFDGQVREALLPLQNITRLAGGEPDAIAALIKGGLKSSYDIVEMSEEDFIETFENSFKGGAQQAKVTYIRASHTSKMNIETKVAMSTSNYVSNIFPMLSDDDEFSLMAGAPAATPDLQTLFGSMDLCNCAECTSMYSPGAYFTDILNFMKKKMGSNPSKAYLELNRRRPDLAGIDLTCKNANTTLPYVDLVNELLEKTILIHNASSLTLTTPIPTSFQTSGTSKELEAYPEHTYKDGNIYKSYQDYKLVYNNVLKNASYPNNLPFDLPLEEARTYMKHLGVNRYDLMYQFRNESYSGTSQETNALAEWLKITAQEAGIISTPHAPSKNTAKYFGLDGISTWYSVLTHGENNEGLNSLLLRSRINYKEMLQMLISDYLNPVITVSESNGSGGYVTKSIRTFTVNSSDPLVPGTCDLTKLYLHFNKADEDEDPLTSGQLTEEKKYFFDKWHRFLRLQRTTGWSFYQLDTLIQSFGITGLRTYDVVTPTVFTDSDINEGIFRNVAKAHQLATMFRLAPEKLCTMWSTISNTRYIDFSNDNQNNLPSLYDTLFRNKAVLNPADANFLENGTISGTYPVQVPTILAALGIEETDWNTLQAFWQVDTTPLTLAGLSHVYGSTLLQRALNISAEELIQLTEIMDVDLLEGTSAERFQTLKNFLDTYARLKKVAFNTAEVNYLITGQDAQSEFVMDADIMTFFDTLRTELKKINTEPVPLNTPEDQMAEAIETAEELKVAKRLNVMEQYFASGFGVEREIIHDLLNTMVYITNTASSLESLSSALQNEEFINEDNSITPANGVTDFSYSELYTAYYKLNRIILIVRRLKMSVENYFSITISDFDLGIDIIDSILGVSATNNDEKLAQFISLNEWFMFRDRFAASDQNFGQLIYHAAHNPTVNFWRDEVLDITQWNADDLNNILTILDIDFSTYGHRSSTLLLRITDIITSAKTLGLIPQKVYNLLTPDIDMDDSKDVRMAAKAHYTDDAWAKIAKPLQDVLRERQRQAMVSYIIGTPGVLKTIQQPVGIPPVTLSSSCKNENELFEFLLIDVEMKPCMKTSRIKQGISSAQLFMDRIVLSLENANGIFGNLITITPEKLAQWESWRKWYRVWEANRKIFLYPENWIEPELRDDKTSFFKELETQLLQDEVKETTAKDAYLAYLERVDEVARLEPVASFREIDVNTGTDVLHVFARTYAEPHRYFYRKLQNNEWTPWQKMNVDIKSDHVAPVVWNNRLFVFWLSFKSKKPANPVNPVAGTWVNTVTGQGASSPIIKDSENDKNTIVEVTLNWTEFKDNKWLSTQFGRDTMTIDMSKIRLGAATTASYQQPATVLKEFSKQFGDDGQMKLEELFKNRLRLYINTASYNPEKELIFNVQMAHGLNEVSLGLHSFAWRDSSAEPRVVRETDYGYTIVAPKGTRFNKTKMVQYGNEKLNMTNTYTFGYGYYLYDKDYLHTTAKILDRNSSDIVLNNTPNGVYKITSRANAFGANASFPERNPLEDNFFFEDGKNTFYVQKEKGTYTSQQLIYNGIIKESKISIDLVKSYTPSKSAGLQLKPQLALGPVISGVTTTGDKYRFHTFYHAQIDKFKRELYRNGIPGLLKLSNQSVPDTMQFQPTYLPNLSIVHSTFPDNNVQFSFDQAYSIYNWEIFFHAPMMIAQRLSDNQQFEEARKWYHYIFDPTSSKDINGATSTAKKRFWKFYPFYEHAQQNTQTLTSLLQAIHNGQLEALKQVEKWENNPFKPHVIARIRTLAYMKNVLMKYLDNLFAWADQLYSRDTIESINEATQLYILAAHLLGKRPEEVPARAATGAKTFKELDNEGLDALSNAIVQIESYFAPNAGPLPTSGGKDGHAINAPMFYFCLPKNDNLLKYWDTLADRLFKIRNCMNIDGVTRQLPLFEPPIDPALLVRAAAAGISIGTFLDGLSGNNLSPYRFNYVVQKANEFANDVKGLGSALLSAIEKKDAEQLALLRSGQEMQLLEKVRLIKEIQIREAEANLEAIRRTKENTQMRQLYYGSRVFMNGGETQHLSSLQTGMILQGIQGGLNTAAGVCAMIPQFHAQVLAAVGASYGGQQISSALNAASSAIGIAAAINGGRGSMALTRAGYERRMDDWKFQASAAGKELEQLDQQILAAEIRLDMAQRELSNHELQIENNAETDAYMRSKFSNAELYNWMISQLQGTYFQSYQLAYNLAKKAEACFDMELPGYQKPAPGFIGFAYWDSLRKGLLSGEKLQFDLRKMESAYMDANQRELELTKNVSLVMTDPKALLDLRKDGRCEIFIPEELYDMDYPGHYLRRIKSVSISLPCIAGPYTTVAATLTLMETMMRKESGINLDPETENTVLLPSIATSGGQNDSGVFELNFRDERYLPFEGRGAISRWELRLADDNQLRQFDFETISDVILHVKYTARDGGAPLREERIGEMNALFDGPAATEPGFGTLLLPRYFSLKHEFSQDWYQYSTAYAGNNQSRVVMTFNQSSFPFFCKDKKIRINRIEARLRGKQPLTADYKLKLTYTQGNNTHVTKTLAMASANDYVQHVDLPVDSDTTSLFINRNTKILQIGLKNDADTTPVNMDTILDDLYFIFTYQVEDVSGAPSPNDEAAADV